MDSNGLLLDPWGNPYRYSVATTTPNGTSRYTGTTGISTIFTNSTTQITNSNGNMLQVCDESTCAGTIIAPVVPALVLAQGDNWASIASASANEQANGSGTKLGTYSVTNNNNFVVTDYSEENYDDMMVWISPHLLFSKLITAGKLP